MNKKIISIFIILSLMISINYSVFANPTDTQSSELKQAQAKKKEYQWQVRKLNDKIDSVLKHIDMNKNDMNEVAKNIKHTETKLEAVEKAAEVEKDLFHKRARAMYVGGVDSYLEVILDSNSFSDFISRVDMLQNIIEYDKNLINKIKEQINVIQQQKEDLDSQNEKLMKLKSQNEAILSKLSTDIKEQKSLLAKITKKESKLIAEKKARELAAAKKAKKLAALKTASISRHLDAKKVVSSTVANNIKSGDCVVMESTAYSIDGFTSSGTKTRRDPNGYSTIAVDPRVIPIGSKVFIEGYGYAIAEDTGSAIKGNIIDVFFNSESEVYNWGRRNVKVYILNN